MPLDTTCTVRKSSFQLHLQMKVIMDRQNIQAGRVEVQLLIKMKTRHAKSIQDPTKADKKRGKVRDKQVPSSQQGLDFNVNETWLSNILLLSSPCAMTKFQMWWRQNLTTFLAEPSKSCQPSACGTKSTLNTSGTITHCAFVFETRATLA